MEVIVKAIGEDSNGDCRDVQLDYKHVLDRPVFKNRGV